MCTYIHHRHLGACSERHDGKVRHLRGSHYAMWFVNLRTKLIPQLRYRLLRRKNLGYFRPPSSLNTRLASFGSRRRASMALSTLLREGTTKRSLTSTSRAAAIDTSDFGEGYRFPASMRLMVAFVIPEAQASFSWVSPFSRRRKMIRCASKASSAPMSLDVGTQHHEISVVLVVT